MEHSDFRQWIEDKYDADELSDIVEGGCVMGVSGLTYYSDTVALYDEHAEEIWERLYDAAKEDGTTTIRYMAQMFSEQASDVGGDDQFKNLLVWWYVEETARELVAAKEAPVEA